MSARLSKLKIGGLCLGGLGVAVLLLLWAKSTLPQQPVKAVVAPVASSLTATASPLVVATPLTAMISPRTNATGYVVAFQTASYQWTSDDGKDTNVIRRLAHNALEYQRMVDENSRIYRRQLVYCSERADALVEKSRLTGEPITQMTIPGLDGQEYVFEISKTDIQPSGLQGGFSGRLAGQPDSMVTLAFKGGREALTILSPATGSVLQIDPYESGSVIVKSVDPNNYIVGSDEVVESPKK